MNKKRITLVLTILSLALLLTGCSSGTSEITSETKFADLMDEGFFAGIITYPLAQIINILTPKVGIVAAIAIITIAINVIVFALTFKSSLAMQRMQEIQPELNKIQAKYEGRDDDMSKQRMALEMQQLYKKYDINPIGSMLTTFIQLPILIGMYNAVRRSSAVINSTFLGVSLATTPKEAIKTLNVVCIIIYLLMIVAQFISIKTPQWLANYRGKIEADKKHKTYHKPENTNAMMTYSMLIMISFVMLSWPTALALYYVIYSIVNIIKTLLIDKLTHKE